MMIIKVIKIIPKIVKNAFKALIFIPIRFK